MYVSSDPQLELFKEMWYCYKYWTFEKYTHTNMDIQEYNIFSQYELLCYKA
jgi:hypothetical protein